MPEKRTRVPPPRWIGAGFAVAAALPPPAAAEEARTHLRVAAVVPPACRIDASAQGAALSCPAAAAPHVSVERRHLQARASATAERSTAEPIPIILVTVTY